MTTSVRKKPWQRRRRFDPRAIFRGGLDGHVFGAQDPNVLLTGAAAAGAATYLGVGRNELIQQWQESTGVTPVMAAETACGLRMDNSRSMVPGTDIRSTGVIGLVGAATAATFNTGTGAGSVTRAGDGSNQSFVTLTTVANVAYRFKATIGGGGGSLSIRQTAAGAALAVLSAGSDGYVTVFPTGTILYLTASNNTTTTTFTISSCVPVPGNHALQATAAARPTHSQRYNQLLATTTLATQSVTVLATSQKLSFTGTGTVTLSGVSTAGPLVGTGANDRVSLTFTPTAGSLTLTVTGSVTLADLRTSDDAAKSIPAYQRVDTAASYDTDGFPSYDKYDGTDDNRVTAGGGGASTKFYFRAVVTVLGGAGTIRTVWNDRSGLTGMIVRVNSTNALEFLIGNGVSFVSSALTANDTVVVGTSYVLTAWFDGTTLYVQINNQTPVSFGMSGTPVAGSAAVSMGVSSAAASAYFNGRIYNSLHIKNDYPGDNFRERDKRYAAQQAGCQYLLT